MAAPRRGVKNLIKVGKLPKIPKANSENFGKTKAPKVPLKVKQLKDITNE